MDLQFGKDASDNRHGMRNPQTERGVARNASYKPVGGLLAGLAVLRWLAKAPSPVSLTDVMRGTGLNGSTCRNILHSLVAEDHAAYDPRSRLYAIGLGVLALAGRTIAQGIDLQPAREEMERLARSHSATVTLWRGDPAGHAILILRASSRISLDIGLHIGSRIPLLAGSAGPLWAGNPSLSGTVLQGMFDRTDPKPDRDLAAFLERTKRAADAGWSITRSKYLPDHSSASVPVFDAAGVVSFVLTLAMPTHRFDSHPVADLIDALQRQAALIQRKEG